MHSAMHGDQQAPDQKENAVADIRYGQLGALNTSRVAVVNAMDDGDVSIVLLR